MKTQINEFELDNGIYSSLTPLTVEQCQLGVPVLTKAGSHFVIEEIKPNEKRTTDLTVIAGNGSQGTTYGSFNGVFPSLYINNTAKEK